MEVSDIFEQNRQAYIGAGFAPGNYWCKCVSCSQRFDGDKRAWRCFDCASSLITVNHEIEALSSCGL